MHAKLLMGLQPFCLGVRVFVSGCFVFCATKAHISIHASSFLCESSESSLRITVHPANGHCVAGHVL